LAGQIEVEVPAPSAHRSDTAGLLNEAALVAMVTQIAAEVEQILNPQRFPVVYGEIAVLLATVPSLAAAAGSTGLLFLDGHEDATPMELSASGEAANMEIAILLGLTSRGLPATLESASGVLDPTRLAPPIPPGPP
jgi:arginase